MKKSVHSFGKQLMQERRDRGEDSRQVGDFVFLLAVDLTEKKQAVLFRSCPPSLRMKC